MQINNELKDILLEKNDNSGTNVKKILLIVAAAVILFLAVIVVMKFINSDPEAKTSANVEIDSRLVLPPAPSQDQNLALNQPMATQPASKPQDVSERKNDEQLFEQVPIMPEGKSQDDFEDMVKKLKGKSETDTSKNDATQQKPEPKLVIKAVEEPKPELTKKVEVKPEPEAKKEEVKKEEPKKVTKEQPKPAAKPESKKEPAKTTTAAVSSSKGAYVQVAAISKPTPDTSLTNKISAKGYSYTTVKAGNMTKVIVGPFSEDKIQNALSDIRKDIASGAFIYRIK
ncbi:MULTISPECIES: SPOR domain-containing protein [unclassified Campylobacter]|uniref:SPOR domain-containing protein n=1 Tax=unclassified Campylobacter TaxID=2593542 RepID=UPI003D34B6C2